MAEYEDTKNQQGDEENEPKEFPPTSYNILFLLNVYI